MDSIMHIYHNFPNDVLQKNLSRSLAVISSNQTKSEALNRYVSQMIDYKIYILDDVKEDPAVIDVE